MSAVPRESQTGWGLAGAIGSGAYKQVIVAIEGEGLRHIEPIAHYLGPVLVRISDLLRIVIPISKPAIATCTIYSFTLIWNEFVLALTFLNKDQLKTFPVAVSTIAGGQYIVPYNILGASMVITIIPALILFIGLQRMFIRGITIGALKG